MIKMLLINGIPRKSRCSDTLPKKDLAGIASAGRSCLAIDLKSFYAPGECRDRKIAPFAADPVRQGVSSC